MAAFLTKYVVSIIKAAVDYDGELTIHGQDGDYGAVKKEDALAPARFLIFFANLKGTPVIDDVLMCVSDIEGENPKNYLDNLLDKLSTIFGDAEYAKLLLVDMAVIIDEKKKKLTVEAVKKKLSDEIRGFFFMAEAMAQLASTAMKPSEDYTDGNGKWLIALSVDSLTHYKSNIHYNVISGNRDGKTVFLDMFSFMSAGDALRFELADIARNDINLKQCENCKKYFIPKARSDEKYCDNAFKNGRTCKQIAFDVMIENDEALRVYRSVYKNQNARMQRHSKGKSDAYKKTLNTRFGSWRDNAKQLLQRCRDGEVGIEEMKKSIEDDSWMREVK